jgi:hypothetical protein
MVDLRFIGVAADDTTRMAAAKTTRSLLAAKCPLLALGRTAWLISQAASSGTLAPIGTIDGVNLPGSSNEYLSCMV